MHRVTIREIKEKYLASKLKEKKFLWTYYVRRPVSYYLAKPFLMLGLSATQLTLIWLFTSVVGCVLLASGDHFEMVLGAVILELSIILDCVDGHIARFTRPTLVGEIVDTWAGEIALVLSILSLGIGVSKQPWIFSVNNSLSIFPALNNNVFLYLGILAALACLSSWVIRVHWRTMAQRLSSNIAEPDENLRSSKQIIIFDNLFHYCGLLFPLIVISALLNVLDVILIVITLVYAVYLPVTMYKIIKQARLLDLEKRKNNI